MPEELKELIEKINEEGVKAAEKKAAQIEDEAKRQAEVIIETARAEAAKIAAETKEEIARMEASSSASIKQAGRDLGISLKKEINRVLEGLISLHIHKALGPEEMAKIIEQLIKGYTAQEKGDITVLLKKEDLEKIERYFTGELKNALKKGVTLVPSEGIHGGFIISYDSGKSYYDFTDKTLAEYLLNYLKPRVAQILGSE
jgi:V/A-type H+-transporting ATPase subunit E